jgi:hypothetical protein
MVSVDMTRTWERCAISGKGERKRVKESTVKIVIRSLGKVSFLR